MSRWSEAYKSCSLRCDSADSADTPPASVSTVSSVIARHDAFEAIERSAIQAEALPARRERKRPVSWARAEDCPAPGDFCGCCAGQLWWSDTALPRGWRCCTCHPPVHLEDGQFRVAAS